MITRRKFFKLTSAAVITILFIPTNIVKKAFAVTGKTVIPNKLGGYELIHVGYRLNIKSPEDLFRYLNKFKGCYFDNRAGREWQNKAFVLDDRDYDAYRRVLHPQQSFRVRALRNEGIENLSCNGRPMIPERAFYGV